MQLHILNLLIFGLKMKWEHIYCYLMKQRTVVVFLQIKNSS